jgi:hypothetical protein
VLQSLRIAMRIKALPLVASKVLFAGTTVAHTYATGEEGTFSIIGHDPVTNEFGMVVQSHTTTVGWSTRGGKGVAAVIANEPSSDPKYGEIGIRGVGGYSPGTKPNVNNRKQLLSNRSLTTMVSVQLF